MTHREGKDETTVSQRVRAAESSQYRLRGGTRASAVGDPHGVSGTIQRSRIVRERRWATPARSFLASAGCLRGRVGPATRPVHGNPLDGRGHKQPRPMSLSGPLSFARERLLLELLRSPDQARIRALDTPRLRRSVVGSIARTSGASAARRRTTPWQSFSAAC